VLHDVRARDAAPPTARAARTRRHPERQVALTRTSHPPRRPAMPTVRRFRPGPPRLAAHHVRGRLLTDNFLTI